MRTLTKAALATPAACAIVLAGATGASADEKWTMNLTDTMGNDSGSSSTAHLTIAGDQLTVDITGTGFTPNSPHAQHFRGSFEDNKDFTCPTSAADADGDGQVNTEEGLPTYGDIMISLTTKGDTSPDRGLAVDRMPNLVGVPHLVGVRARRAPHGRLTVVPARLVRVHVRLAGPRTTGEGATNRPADVPLAADRCVDPLARCDQPGHRPGAAA